MQFAISTSSLAAADLDAAFAQAAKAGADGVEVVYDTAAAAAIEQWEQAAEGLKSLAAKHRRPIAALNLAVLRDKPTLVGDAKAVAAAQHLVRDALTVAAAAGVGIVSLPFFEHNALETLDHLDRAAEALAELVEGAEEAGVVLGIESTLNFDQQQFLLDYLGNSAVAKICYNTGEALARKRDAATAVRDLGGERIAQVHFKDVRLVEGKPPEFDIALGEGDVDFRAVALALQAVGFDGWVILETPPGKDPVAGARANLTFAQGLIETT